MQAGARRACLCRPRAHAGIGRFHMPSGQHGAMLHGTGAPTWYARCARLLRQPGEIAGAGWCCLGVARKKRRSLRRLFP